MTEYNGGSPKADHLCVLVHGLWGTPAHMGSIAAALRKQYSEDRLHLLVAKRNSGWFTYDGVETGGERVCTEIEETLDSIKESGGNITRISLIGYSLGGLVSRYAVGLLHARGILDKLECVNFTAFASPFLGVRSPLKGQANFLWNIMGARTLSESGRQLFGVDSFRDTGRPLLAVLADPDSIFMAGLARFRRRTLYANIVNDRSAVYYTTAISKTDPYSAATAAGGELDDMNLNFIPGYDDIILDKDSPILPGKRKKQKAQKAEIWKIIRAFLSNPSSREAQHALLEASRIPIFIALLPLLLSGFLANAAYQTVQSSRRRQLHEGGLAGINVHQYRMPLWIKGLQETAEGAYENINNALEPDFLTDADEGSSGTDSKAASDNGKKTNGDANVRQRHSTLPVKAQSTPVLPSEHQHTLALTPEQFAMIDALDSLGWRKYPVWIHKVMHSHAAIVVRSDTPRFDEGRVILKHYATTEFLF